MNQHHLPTIPDFCRYCLRDDNLKQYGAESICEACDDKLVTDLKEYGKSLISCFNTEAEALQNDIESWKKKKRHDISSQIAILELRISAIKYGVSLIEWYDEFGDIK